ncbi:MAG: hypothetical protein H6736_24825 [Alphaproteobacteria bacterium]|nr:hypothetical protein [Alphaproteobacteria bacterium]
MERRPSETGKPLEARLDELADGGDAAGQPGFAARLVDLGTPTALRLFDRWPARDPRWTTTCAWWLRGGRLDGTGLARSILSRWDGLHDARLTRARAEVPERRDVGTTHGGVLYDIASARSPADTALPETLEPTIEAVHAEARAALDALVAVRDASFAAVDRGDLEALAVIADARIEAGDPWGRYLQLQLAFEERGRLQGALKNEMLALLRAHQMAWFHPLPLLLGDLRTRLGVPCSARTSSTRLADLLEGCDPVLLEGLTTLTCTNPLRQSPPGRWAHAPAGRGEVLTRVTG